MIVLGCNVQFQTFPDSDLCLPQFEGHNGVNDGWAFAEGAPQGQSPLAFGLSLSLSLTDSIDMSLDDRLGAIGPTHQVWRSVLSAISSLFSTPSVGLFSPQFVAQHVNNTSFNQEKKEFREYLHKYGVVDSMMRCTAFARTALMILPRNMLATSHS